MVASEIAFERKRSHGLGVEVAECFACTNASATDVCIPFYLQSLWHSPRPSDIDYSTATHYRGRANVESANARNENRV